MSRAIVLRETGGPDVLRLEEVEIGRPAAGQLRIRHEAIGVNFHDVYVRSGLYRTLSLPGIPGLEAAGKVVAVGQGVADFQMGDRIAYLDTNYGGYAEERVLDAALAIKLPEPISTRLAASLLLKGLTAAILATRVHRPRPGEWAVVHAAAGGVGRLLGQWLASHGTRVIGTVGSSEKAQIALASGCEKVVLYRDEDLAARVADITDGRGADVIFDAVGRDTFDMSLAALAPCGHLVIYGQSSGPIAPLEVGRLAQKSATVTRPAYAHYIRDRDDLLALAGALWSRIAERSLVDSEGVPFALAEAPEAHRALEHRVAGPIILVP